MAFSINLAAVYTSQAILGNRKLGLCPTLPYTRTPGYTAGIDHFRSAQFTGVNRSLACSSTTTAPLSEERLAGQNDFKGELVNAIREELSSLEDVGKMGSQSLLEALTLVDLIEKLGIQRYFEQYIDNILSSLFTFWDEKEGLKDAQVTVLAFRLLRLHGYSISADVLITIKDRDVAGFAASFSVTSSNISGVLNLYRCSLLSFRCESKIMGEAKKFAMSQLRAVLLEEGSPLIQAKHHRSEIIFTLEYPRQCLLPRLESRFIIRLLWPGNERNRNILQLAKLELNMSQKQCQKELAELEKWWTQQGFEQYDCGGVSIRKLIFAVAPTFHEPQFSAYRMAFAKICSHTSILDILVDKKTNDIQHIRRFTEAIKSWDPSLLSDLPLHKRLLESICTTMQEFAIEAGKVQDRDLLPLFKDIWYRYASVSVTEAEWIQSGYIPCFEEYMEAAHYSFAGEIITWTSIFLMGERITDEIFSQVGVGSRFTYLVGFLGRLANDLVGMEKESRDGKLATAVSCFQRDNPQLSREESIASIKALVESTCQELEEELHLSREIVPECIGRAVINYARTAMFLYKIEDGFNTDIKEYFELFKDFFFGSLDLI